MWPGDNSPGRLIPRTLPCAAGGPRTSPHNSPSAPDVGHEPIWRRTVAETETEPITIAESIEEIRALDASVTSGRIILADCDGDIWQMRGEKEIVALDVTTRGGRLMVIGIHEGTRDLSWAQYGPWRVIDRQPTWPVS